MAVTNFHYITRMSSGFKVYILEGQPHLRSEDRFRHITSDRIRVTAAHPFKHKQSSEQGRTLEERRERAQSKRLVNADRTASQFNVPESPTSTWSPKTSPAHLSFNAVIDEPLALVKKMPLETDNKNKITAVRQVRPSVITCGSSTKSACMPVACCKHSPVITQHSYDNVEEHFQRSLGVNYQKCSKQISISVSVDDHFAKALGEKWLELKASSSACSSSSIQSTSSSCLTSNPPFIHSSGYGHSPKRARKDCASPTAAPPACC
ncbi:vestigial like 4 like [Tachysurus ichikawai]